MMTNGILNRRTNDLSIPENYYMRPIDLKELNRVVELENHVYENLLNKNILFMDSYEEMLDDMKSGAKIIGVFNEANDLIAYRYISFPGLRSKSLAYDIELPRSQMDKVVHLETTVVHPDYRGNALQSLTLQHAAAEVKALGYRHLLCTVSPQNMFSLYNIMKNGLKIKALKRKYKSPDNPDGLWRFILHKDMAIKSYERPIDSFMSKLENLDEQKHLIDMGYIGFNIFRENRLLNYAKFGDVPHQGIPA